MPTSAEIRQRITEQVISSLEEEKLPPWRQPWVGQGLPMNVVSKRRYTGINILLLQLHRMKHPHLQSHVYGTFKQWQDLGCRIKRRPKDVPPGQWGCSIVFYKMLKKTERNDHGVAKEVEYPLLRTYTIFSASQVSGPNLDRFHTDDVLANSTFTDYEPAEQAIAATGADIRFGFDEAFYLRPMSNGDGDGDYIGCPSKQRFRKEEDFYATLLHELGHWSEVRLDWQGSRPESELRAEMAACFAMAELNVPQSHDLSNHKAYVANWLQALHDDPRFIFRASTAASKAVDYLLSFSRTPVETLEPVA
jgi:antirestriction protein ArdC